MGGCTLNNFSIKIYSVRSGFTKEQVEIWAEEIHGPEADIEVEEIKEEKNNEVRKDEEKEKK